VIRNGVQRFFVRHRANCSARAAGGREGNASRSPPRRTLIYTLRRNHRHQTRALHHRSPLARSASSSPVTLSLECVMASILPPGYDTFRTKTEHALAHAPCLTGTVPHTLTSVRTQRCDVVRKELTAPRSPAGANLQEFWIAQPPLSPTGLRVECGPGGVTNYLPTSRYPRQEADHRRCRPWQAAGS
jgi:hypothetical protein